MSRQTAAEAYATARTELASQIAELQQMFDRAAATDLASVDWSHVGSLHDDVVTLHEVTDRFNHRGEYATTT